MICSTYKLDLFFKNIDAFFNLKNGVFNHSKIAKNLILQCWNQGSSVIDFFYNRYQKKPSSRMLHSILNF